MRINQLYYFIKPLLPRALQIAIRSRVAVIKRPLFGDVWPIDERACEAPADWGGWPEGKKFAIVLTHDVDTARGQGRCYNLMDLERKMDFRSSFNFVPEGYAVSQEIAASLKANGFEVGVHGLRNDGSLFRSREEFQRQAVHINRFLKEWESAGFRAHCMYHNLEWMGALDIEYDSSTFDTDPFEPQPDGVRTIFPFWVPAAKGRRGYTELPYTLPQDFTLFVLLREKTIDIWKKKLDWIAGCGGMALVNTHPDYMVSKGERPGVDEYPARLYEEFLDYIRKEYEGSYWHALPREMAAFWSSRYVRGVGNDGAKPTKD